MTEVTSRFGVGVPVGFEMSPTGELVQRGRRSSAVGMTGGLTA